LLLERLVLGADWRHCFTAIKPLTEKLSQIAEIPAGMFNVGIDVATLADRVIPSRCQRHVACAHDVLSDLLNAMSSRDISVSLRFCKTY
jgi:hypothetical protein